MNKMANKDKILEFLGKVDGATLEQIGKATGIKHHQVSGYLMRLKRQRMIESVPAIWKIIKQEEMQ